MNSESARRGVNFKTIIHLIQKEQCLTITTTIQWNVIKIHSNFFICVVPVWVCAHVCTFMWRQRWIPGAFFITLHFMTWGSYDRIEPELIDSATSWYWRAKAAFASLLQCRVTDVSCHIWLLFVGSENPNSDPHLCATEWAISSTQQRAVSLMSICIWGQEQWLKIRLAKYIPPSQCLHLFLNVPFCAISTQSRNNISEPNFPA